MGLQAEQKKSLYIIFTTAGYRTNYSRTYSINLRINESLIPLEPYPTFLVIKLDPKLNYKNHLEKIETKIESRSKLICKIKGLNLGGPKNILKINF